MKKGKQIILLLILVIHLTNCRNNEEEFPCECNGPDVSLIVEERGTIIETGDPITHFVIRRDSDQKEYYSCSGLADEYKVGDLNIIFSGAIKLPCPNAFYLYGLLQVTEIRIE